MRLQADDADFRACGKGGGVGCAQDQRIGAGQALQHGGVLHREGRGDVSAVIRCGGKGGAQMVGAVVVGGEFGTAGGRARWRVGRRASR